jgi:heterodisulfide reductase subunit D
VLDGRLTPEDEAAPGSRGSITMRARETPEIVVADELASFVRKATGDNPYLCYQCQRCSSSCPTASSMITSPSRMMRMAQLGMKRRLLADSSIWRCLGCDSCTVHCPYEVGVRGLVEVLRGKAMQEYYLAGRREIFAADGKLAAGLEALAALGLRVRERHNVSGEDNSSRLAWTANLARKPAGIDRKAGAQTVYFVGCVSSLFPMSYAIPQAFTAVLEKAGVDFTTMGSDEWCCGFPLMMAGQLEQTRQSMMHNINRVRELGARRVVMSCPSCYHMWKHVYQKELGESLGFEILTSSELIQDLLVQGRLASAEPHRPSDGPQGQSTTPQTGGPKLRPGIVTYHDPCDLGRKGGHYDEPRQVLRSIPGLTLVEMENNREHALCCGGGGDLETFAPELTAEVAARRVAQAAAVNAAYLVSACPQCVRTLTKAVRAASLRIRVMDIVQIVEAALATDGLTAAQVMEGERS